MDKSEQERREAALAAFGGDVISAQEVTPREIRQMLSVRMEPNLVTELRTIAESRGVKVSDLVREAAARLVAEFRVQEIQVQTWTRSQTVRVEPVVVISSWNGQAAFGASYLQPN